MEAERDDVLDLAASVCDGVALNWEREEMWACEDPALLELVGSFRVLSGVALAHDMIPDGRSEEAAGTTATLVDGSTGPPHAAEPVPEQWGALRILRRLGEGGFGEVFLALDPSLDREVALKLLRSDRPGKSQAASAAIDEGRKLARVRHPNVVSVHGADRHGGRFGVWMDYVRGRSLAAILEQDGPMGPREAALIGIDVCRALAAVHRADLLHRDIKAQNVMREEGGRIVLMDFGAAEVAAAPRDASEDGNEERRVIGTPLYMAPDVLQGVPASVASDLYAVGVLLYHLVTRRFPVEASSHRELVGLHESGARRLLGDERPDLPGSYVRVVERAIARDPAERYRSAGELEQALSAALGTDSDAARRSGEGAVERDVAIAAQERGRRRVGTLPLALTAALGAVGMVLLAWGVFGGPTRPLELETTLLRSGELVGASLKSGDSIAPGDQLFLDVRIAGSRPAWVYVLTQDSSERGIVLFPLSGSTLVNPLPAGVRHRLPGAIAGREKNWRVGSAGGRETFLIVASRSRLTALERGLEGVKTARIEGEGGVSADVMAALRGIDSVVDAGDTHSAQKIAQALREITSGSVAPEDVWTREIVLANPGH